MNLGYITNGLPHHRWKDALDLLADAGYRSVGITVDHEWLDPFSPGLAGRINEMRRELEQRKLQSVIETGARFLLDPRVKHEPTLMTADAGARTRRVKFLVSCVDIAADLGSNMVSFWSGILRDSPDEPAAFSRLEDGCRPVIEHAAGRNVRLAFEPEPGMFIDTLEKFKLLKSHLKAPHFGLNMDIGHVHCMDEGPIPDRIHEWKDLLFNVHIEDMKRGVHEHLAFGDGEIDFPPVMAALRDIDYSGGVHVELSRHGHAAPDAVRSSMNFLERANRES